MKKLLFILLLLPMSLFSQTCTSSGSCNTWRGSWTESGKLGNYQPNQNESAILKDILISTKDIKNIEVVMVRYDDIYKQYIVLYKKFKSDGSIIFKDMDLEYFKYLYKIN